MIESFRQGGIAKEKHPSYVVGWYKAFAGIDAANRLFPVKFTYWPTKNGV
ncbi:hypothetical protein HanPSC8_Chr01g0035421 [Helianthus annuus]|nr:hypothetical protein HanPSC8_Chr01g0035421 [Helianthus annuus]